MTPPEARNTLLVNGPHFPTVVDPIDVMRLDRMPPLGGMELELREWVTTFEEDLGWIIATLWEKLTPILLLNALVIGPASRLFGQFLDSPILLPIWIWWGGSRGLSSLSLRNWFPDVPWSYVYLRFLTPLLVPIVLPSIYSPSFSRPPKFCALVVVLVFVGLVADWIATQGVYYVTADLRLRRVARQFRRGCWCHRFDGLRLLRVARKFKEASSLAAAMENEDVARVYRLDAEFLTGLAFYPVSFLILPLYGYLLIFCTFDMQAVLPPACLFILGAWRWGDIRTPAVLVVKTILPVFMNWLCWSREAREYTPGMFWSRFGTASDRLSVTIALFWAVSSMFLPPVWEWFFGAAPLLMWIWATLCRVLLLLLFPLLMLLTTLAAVGGFPLYVLHSEIGGRFERQED